MKKWVGVLGTTAVLFVGAGPLRAAQLSAQQILAQVAATYSRLHDYQLDAVRTITTAAAGQVGVSSRAHYTLAVSLPGRIRLHLKEEGTDLLVVSDGTTTWWYLAGKKIYTRQSAAAMWPSADEKSWDIDTFSDVERVLVERYRGVARLAASVSLKGKGRVKSDGKKVPCYVLELRLPDWTHQLWIDTERFLVLRHREVKNSVRHGVMVRREMQIEVKEARLADPPADLFAFTPPPEAREVTVLGVPGERVSLSGKPAADFSVRDTEGEKVRLSDLRGKVVLLDFWATWCPPCRTELPYMDKLYREGKDKNLVVLGVNDEDAGTIKKFLQTNSYALPTLVDSSGLIHKLYGIRAIPTVVVINRDGMVVADYVGKRTEEEVAAALKTAGL
jgi:peroxiredoxin/outer membrane lipoprotein-sorting protein